MAKPKVTIGTANYGEDFTVAVDGLDPATEYQFVLGTPEGSRSWQDAADTGGHWEQSFPCNFRGPYTLDVYGPPTHVVSGEGRGVA